MKFSQLIEFNMRNIFHEKSFTKSGGETSLRLFLKKNKIEDISGSVVLNFMQFVFIVFQVEIYQIKLKLSCRPLAPTSYEVFLKNKSRSGTSLSVTFSVYNF